MSQIKFNARHGLSVGAAVSISDDIGNFTLTSLSVSGTSTLGALSASSLSVSGAVSFTVSPTAPNVAVNDSSTKIANTAFVLGQVGTAGPLMNGTQTVGTSLLYSRQDHVHASDTSRAAVLNPSFTGFATIAAGSVAVSTPFLNMSQTWNGSGVAFSGIKATVTNTASSPSSLMLDLQSGSNKFGVNVGGAAVQVLDAPNIARDIVGVTGSRHVREYQDLTDDGVQGLPGSLGISTDSFEWGYTWNAKWDTGSSTYLKDRNNAGDHAFMYRVNKRYGNQWWFSDGTTPGAITWAKRIDFDLPANTYTFAGTLAAINLTVSGTVNSGLNLTTGNTFSINSVSVLNATTLGTGIINSSIKTLGTVTAGVWNGTTIALANGGTGAVTQVGAATAILPAAVTSGHVLTTGGAGTFYWAPQTGAAGNVGTLLNTTRAVSVATAGQTSFSTNSYMIGAKQLRVYINGVRQYDSEYVESTTTSFTLNAPGAALDDVVMSEVDGYVNYVFTAAATSFTPISGITATEVQSAIAALQSNKAAIVGQTFTTPNIGVASGTSLILSGGLTLAGTANQGFPAGTRLMFQQSVAPTGWTKDTTHNDKAMRVVSGSVVNGGSVAFTTAFASQSITGSNANTVATGTVDSHTLSITEIPSHTHTVPFHGGGGSGTQNSTTNTYAVDWRETGAIGGGLGHVHPFTGVTHGHSFTGNAVNLAVQYVDVIIAQKD